MSTTAREQWKQYQTMMKPGERLTVVGANLKLEAELEEAREATEQARMETARAKVANYDPTKALAARTSIRAATPAVGLPAAPVGRDTDFTKPTTTADFLNSGIKPPEQTGLTPEQHAARVAYSKISDPHERADYRQKHWHRLGLPRPEKSNLQEVG